MGLSFENSFMTIQNPVLAQFYNYRGEKILNLLYAVKVKQTTEVIATFYAQVELTV